MKDICIILALITMFTAPKLAQNPNLKQDILQSATVESLIKFADRLEERFVPKSERAPA